METIESRVVKLERSNRRYRTVAFAAVVGVIGVLLIGASQEEKPYKLLKALKYQVINESGKVLVEMGADSSGTGTVKVYDAGGNILTQLGGTANGSSAYGQDLSGKWTGTWTASDGSSDNPSTAVVIDHKDGTVEATVVRSGATEPLRELVGNKKGNELEGTVKGGKEGKWKGVASSDGKQLNLVVSGYPLVLTRE